MNTKQFQKIAKGLLSDLPIFKSEGKMMFKFPVDDFLRALYFENTSDANRFHLSAFVMPLFVPTEHIYFNYGKRIGNAVNWRLDNSNLLTDLRATVHADAIPFFERVSSLAGVLDYLKAGISVDEQRANPHTMEALAYTLIRSGDNSSALETFSDLKQIFGTSTTPWVLELTDRAQTIAEKLQRDPALALAQLEEWKRLTLKNLKLEAYCMNP